MIRCETLAQAELTDPEVCLPHPVAELRRKQHQHDEIVDGYLDERIGRIAVGQVAPDKNHRGAGRGRQYDDAGNVLVSLSGRDPA